jgi:hypothetical protein
VSAAFVALWLAAAPLHAIDEALPGPDSAATAFVLKRLLEPLPAFVPFREPLHLDCFTTPGHAEMIGIRQEMAVEAPLKDVAAVIEDFPAYAQLFPDVVEVHKLKGSEHGNRFAVSTEQHIPVFFIPNLVIETTYLVDRTPSRTVYRYKLKEQGRVKATDGFIVLEPLSSTRTRYVELDFIEADTGPISMATVWEQSLSGFYRSDVALKLKAEQPALSYEKIRAEAERLFEKFPQAACYARRKPR